MIVRSVTLLALLASFGVAGAASVPFDATVCADGERVLAAAHAARYVEAREQLHPVHLLDEPVEPVAAKWLRAATAKGALEALETMLAERAQRRAEFPRVRLVEVLDVFPGDGAGRVWLVEFRLRVYRYAEFPETGRPGRWVLEADPVQDQVRAARVLFVPAQDAPDRARRLANPLRLLVADYQLGGGIERSSPE